MDLHVVDDFSPGQHRSGQIGHSREGASFMVKMIHSPSTSSLGIEFNDFLQAPISEDRKVAHLSVMSALARLNVDPWAEAANLARLPGKAAEQRLAELLARAPEIKAAGSSCEAAATRLVQLLPRRKASGVSGRWRDRVTGANVISAVCVLAMILAAITFGRSAMNGRAHDPALASAVASSPPAAGAR